jgi:hypothetical protein
MKAVLFAIAMIAGSSAFAHSDCKSVFVGTGEAGQGYYTSCPSDVHRGCIDGEIGSFPTTQYGAEGGPVEVTRVCKNGTFFPTVKPAPVLACHEGEITYVSTGIYGSEGGPAEVAVVCRHGKFVPAY